MAVVVKYEPTKCKEGDKERNRSKKDYKTSQRQPVQRDPRVTSDLHLTTYEGVLLW